MRPPRFEIINGQRIKCYDIGTNKSFDRYTVVYVDQGFNNYDPKIRSCLAMSERPFHPQGFGQHSGAMTGPHLGRRIKFEDMPPDCQKAVMQDLKHQSTEP